MTRVLFVSSEPVGERMAGPAIRALELARALAEHCEVTIAAPPPSEAPLPLLEAGLADFDSLVDAFRGHDVVVAQQLPAQLLRRLERLPARYVADLYNPLPVEALEAGGDRGSHRRVVMATLAQCAAADFAICASEKQRDFWLGAMTLWGLVDVESYGQDPTYRSFLDVVPFGTADRPPKASAPVLKGVLPGIESEDRVLLWGGGVWRWLDAETPIRAVERLWDGGLRAHLVFQGVERPSLEPGDIPSEAARAIEYARERGLEGRCVHFNRGWVPYEERDAWLLDADIGVSCHHDHLESRFSFRTRVLDYLWAGLPVVATRGDAMSDLVERRGLGRVVGFGDDEALAAACRELLDDSGRYDEAVAAAREVAAGLRWSEVVRPLADFCLRSDGGPRRRAPRGVLALATYGQYPHIAADLRRRRGAREILRRGVWFLKRALRSR